MNLAASTFDSYRASGSTKSQKSFALALTRRRHRCRYTCLRASTLKARNKQARHVIDYLLVNPLQRIYREFCTSLSLSLSHSPCYTSVSPKFRFRIYRTTRYSRPTESLSPWAYHSLCLRTYISGGVKPDRIHRRPIGTGGERERERDGQRGLGERERQRGKM